MKLSQMWGKIRGHGPGEDEVRISLSGTYLYGPLALFELFIASTLRGTYSV